MKVAMHVAVESEGVQIPTLTSAYTGSLQIELIFCRGVGYPNLHIEY